MSFLIVRLAGYFFIVSRLRHFIRLRRGMRRRLRRRRKRRNAGQFLAELLHTEAA